MSQQPPPNPQHRTANETNKERQQRKLEHRNTKIPTIIVKRLTKNINKELEQFPKRHVLDIYSYIYITGPLQCYNLNHTVALQWMIQLNVADRCMLHKKDLKSDSIFKTLPGTEADMLECVEAFLEPQKLIRCVCAFHLGHLSLLTPINPCNIMVTCRRFGSHVNQ